MDRLPPLAILVAGIVLIIYGASSPRALRDDLPKAVGGLLTDKPKWMLIGGALGTLAGLFGLLHGSMSLVP
jgi:hypothetical protein